MWHASCCPAVPAVCCSATRALCSPWRAKSFVLALFPTSIHAREKKSPWKPNHCLRWNQDWKLSQVLAFHVLSSAQAQCFVTQTQAMYKYNLRQSRSRREWISQHGVTVWEQLSIFRHDGLHSAEVIYLVSMLLLRNTIRWIHTWGCKMCNSLTAFKDMGWTPPASSLAPCSHFFLAAFILDNAHPGGTQQNKSVTHKEETMNMKQAKCSWFWCIWGSFPWVNTTEILEWLLLVMKALKMCLIKTQTFMQGFTGFFKADDIEEKQFFFVNLLFYTLRGSERLALWFLYTVIRWLFLHSLKTCKCVR